MSTLPTFTDYYDAARAQIQVRRPDLTDFNEGSVLDAMAGAELLLGKHPRGGSGLYVYARETVGFALVIGGRVHSPTSGPGTVAGLPVQSDLLGGSGQLESTVSDEAVVAAARRTGILRAV